MEEKLEMLGQIFQKHGFEDYKWIDPGTIVVSHWVRMKCRFGCEEYGRNASCPPNLPSVEECAAFFKEYRSAVVFHFQKAVRSADELKRWVKALHAHLVKMEKEIFLAGFEKAFVLLVDSCSLCAECSGSREMCKNPKIARPTVEALAVDVYKTVRAIGYPIEVRSEIAQEMDRYAILLLE
jgi:predicted metal-binding protein